MNPYKKSSDITHKKLDEFKQECTTEQMYRNTLCGLLTYLNWRKISIEDLMNSDSETETKELSDFVEDEELRKTYKRKSLMVKVAFIKRFLRWLGIKIIRYDRAHQVRTYFFDEDKIFKDFINYDLADKKNTRRQHKNTMNHFLLFLEQEFNKKYYPSDFVEEINNDKYTIPELRRLLQKFHDFNQERTNEDGKPLFKKSTSWQHTLRIGKFIRLTTGKTISFGFSDDQEDYSVNDIHLGGNIIDLETLRTLLKNAEDIRTKCLILILAESGCSPVEIEELKVKEFNYYDSNKRKQSYLNIDNPEEISNETFFMIQRKRKKTRKSFLFSLSFQSLRMISRYLYMRREGLITNGIKEKITEESYIITQDNSADNLPLSAQSITRTVRKASLNAGFEIIFLPRDFRKSWRTQANALTHNVIDSVTGKEIVVPIVPEVVKNNILGHITTESNYDRNEIETFFLQHYIKIWKSLFDLENVEGMEEKFKAEVENKYKKEMEKMKRQYQEVKSIVDVIKDQGVKWDTLDFTEEEIEEMKELQEKRKKEKKHEEKDK